MARYADEAGMALGSRANSKLRVTFYETDSMDQIDTSHELDRLVVTGIRDTLHQAREWLTQDEPRRVRLSGVGVQDFLDGKVPDLVVSAYNGKSQRDLVAVVEVDYADVTE